MSVSVKVLSTPPEPASAAAPDAWSIAEAQLATAKVHALLDESSARLTRLAGEATLPDEVVDGLRETLKLVESGRQVLGATRRRLPTR